MPDVQIMKIPPQPALITRYQTNMSDMGQTMSAALGKLMRYLGEHNLQPAGMPFSLYPRMEPDAQNNWEVVSGIPVTHPITDTDQDIENFELPGGRTAVATHIGPYEALGQTYDAMKAYLEQHQYQPNGPMWEHYFTNPTEEPDQSKWRTDIYWPVKPV